MLTRRSLIRLYGTSGVALVCGAAAAQSKPARTGNSGQPSGNTNAATGGSATPKGPVLSEQEPQAVALGYVTDARKVDKAKFAKYQAGQRCANCQLYQGAPTLPMAPCAVFAGKQVAGPGWCSAYAPRAS